ncbi:flagellar protein FlgN [Eubacterium oxidoreducens]|uniref:FlgN protein n=1 Tax=Eubacterium oxidoreducens TaxID=1732 RepID=A0A1G6BRP3_EUBOX|nr:flagellar protein FlgN [Eubacterium oxidoreducens]SDB23291.1 FlgN protein [Eubacterium oxidoreducens]
MASLMENLLDVLEREHKEYEKLFQLGQRKRQILIDADVEELEVLTEREQDVSSTLRNLENKREQIMDDMSVVLNRKKEEMTLGKMIEILDKQPEQQSRLTEIRTKLGATLKEVSAINEQNRVLTQQALELVEYDLNLFRSFRQAPETANYNRNAYNTGDLLGSSGFDTKQ